MVISLNATILAIQHAPIPLDEDVLNRRYIINTKLEYDGIHKWRISRDQVV